MSRRTDTTCTDPPESVPGLSWWSLILAVILGRIFADRMAKQLELAHLNVAVLKRQIAEGTKRPRPTPREKRRMAELAKDLGRAALYAMAPSQIFTPDTFLRWWRQLCVAKYDSSQAPRKPGRPRTPDETRAWVIRIALENRRFGYTRIHDVMRAIKFQISRTTVANILREEGIPIAPHRGLPWKDFIAQIAGSLAAMDMFTVDTPSTCYYVLFAIRVQTRELFIAGITEHPTAYWMANRARALIDPFDGFLRDCRHVIHDGDPSFRYGLDPVLRSVDIEVHRTPPRSPNLNAYAERWIRSCRGECLDDLPIVFAEQLRFVLKQYSAWYNHERPHQGLAGAYINRLDTVGDGPVVTTSRLAGKLKHYGRTVA